MLCRLGETLSVVSCQFVRLVEDRICGMKDSQIKCKVWIRSLIQIHLALCSVIGSFRSKFLEEIRSYQRAAAAASFELKILKVDM